jgi:hypothetical protein
MMRVAIFAAIIVATALAGPTQASNSPVTVTVTPKVLTLCPDSTEEALIIVQNNGQTPVRNLCLTFFSNGPVEMASPDLTPCSDRISSTDQHACTSVAIPLLPKGASFSKLIRVKLTEYPATDSALHFQANYRSGKPPDDIPAVAVGALTVQGRNIPNDNAMAVKTMLDFASLHEKEKGRLLVTITNASSEHLMLETLGPGSLSFAIVKPLSENKSLPLPIPPQSIVAFGYEIEAKEKIRPGTYVGLVDVAARTECGAPICRAADYTVKLGVFGQSELLTALGIPSLLLLPGFLIVTLWMLLWRFRRFRLGVLFGLKEDDKFAFTVKDPEFWLLGITFSLLIFIFARFFPGFGYQQAYQLYDIAWLWAVSIVFGLALYFSAFRYDRWLQKKAQKRLDAAKREETERTLTTDDDVLTALKRMRLRGAGIKNCQRVTSRDQTDPFKGFRLWSDNEGQTFWVIPPIRCRILNRRLYEELDPEGKLEDTGAFLESLRKLAQKGGSRVEWLENGTLTGPKNIKPADYSEESEYFNFLNAE